MSTGDIVIAVIVLFLLTLGYVVPFIATHVVENRNVAVAIFLIGLLIVAILTCGFAALLLG